MRRFYMHDGRGSKWGPAAVAKGIKRGFKAELFTAARDVKEDSYVLIRPHSQPPRIFETQALDANVREIPDVRCIQDRNQIALYEDKVAQANLLGPWMPYTRISYSPEQAQQIALELSYPFISKAAPGASSQNVRQINNYDEAMAEVVMAFGDGIPLKSAGWPPQKGYVYWQQYIPHDVTYRVNALGNQRAIFLRYGDAQSPFAITGNTQPMFNLNPKMESLLEFSNEVFAGIGTKWCAIDVLRAGERWWLLESSPAWPWPSPGLCNKNIIRPSHKRWIDLWDVLFDEIEAEAFDEK